MSAVASQITGVAFVCSTVYPGVDQRKLQSSVSLAFVRGIHRWPVDSPHKGPVTRIFFHLMTPSWDTTLLPEPLLAYCQLDFRKQASLKFLSMQDIFSRKYMSNNICKILYSRVTHIRVSKLTIIGSDNGLSPGRRQAIIWTNAGILLIRTLGTNFSEILGKIHSSSFKKMHLKMSSAKERLFILGLTELTVVRGGSEVDSSFRLGPLILQPIWPNGPASDGSKCAQPISLVLTYGGAARRRDAALGAWMSNYTHSFTWDVITHPCPNLNCGFNHCAKFTTGNTNICISYLHSHNSQSRLTPSQVEDKFRLSW